MTTMTNSPKMRQIGMPYRGYRARPFLTAYYSELRAHLERKLLVGKRRGDKHDAR